jgi:hypothetical protein
MLPELRARVRSGQPIAAVAAPYLLQGSEVHGVGLVASVQGNLTVGPRNAGSASSSLPPRACSAAHGIDTTVLTTTTQRAPHRTSTRRAGTPAENGRLQQLRRRRWIPVPSRLQRQIFGSMYATIMHVTSTVRTSTAHRAQAWLQAR